MIKGKKHGCLMMECQALIYSLSKYFLSTPARIYPGGREAERTHQNHYLPAEV